MWLVNSEMLILLLMLIFYRLHIINSNVKYFYFIGFGSFFQFDLYSTFRVDIRFKMKRIQLSGAHKWKLSKEKQEKTLDLQSKTTKLTDFFTQVPRAQRQHDIPILNQNESPSSEVDTNTTLITSKSKYDDVGITEVSQAGSSTTGLTTDLTLPVNSLDTFTVNVDSSCFTRHSGVEIIAENESLVDHGDGGEMNQYAKDRRRGVGLGQQLEKQIQEECDYWEYILMRVIAVICTLAERGLAFRGTEERFGS